MTEKKLKNKNPIPCKVVLVGDSGVGKTSIINRYLQQYNSTPDPTLAAYYYCKNINVEGFNIDFEIWDTAGQEQYRSINTLFFKNTCMCILVYDITSQKSFDSLRNYWYDSVIENSSQDVILSVAGNKYDLYEEEDVDEKEVKEFCDSIGAMFVLTSALLNTSIDQIFNDLAKKLIETEKFKNIATSYIDKNESEDGDESKHYHEGSVVLQKKNVIDKKSKKKECCKV